MDFWQITLPVAGIKTYLFIPPLVAFAISFFTSMAGISGAFLVMPFQVSVLGFASPSASATNFLYNVVGTPGGVVRYASERRMVWPLAMCIISGTLPGVLLGYYLRATFLPDPRPFKLFVGLVLLVVGFRLVINLWAQKKKSSEPTDEKFFISDTATSLKTISFSFMGERIRFSAPAIFLPSVAVGVISGIYGIGGGAIIAPFLVSFLRIPVYAAAGTVLAANFTTSLAGMLIYSALPFHQGATAPPDWLLGILFGIGGLLGMYLGAKWQRHMPETAIKVLLAAVLFTVSGKYIMQFF